MYSSTALSGHAKSTRISVFINMPDLLALGRPEFRWEYQMNPRLALLVLSLTSAMLAAPALSAAADVERGKTLAYTCHGCHGIPNLMNSYPVYRVPKLGGQHSAYLQIALKAYAAQERNHSTMYAHAATMSEQDMEDISAYLSGQELTSTGRAVGTAPKASQTCVACHGNDGIGIMPEYPSLSGQHAGYLEQALKAYRSGKRSNAVMAGMASPLTDEDIKELAAYYSSQRPSLCSTDEVRDGGKCAGM